MDEDFSITKKNIRQIRTDIEFGSFVSYMTATKPPYNRLVWKMDKGIVTQRCPFCEGRARLKADLRDYDKYGESIFVSYVCDTCEEGFTTNEIDEINIAEPLAKKRGIAKVVEAVKSILKTKNKEQNGRSNHRQQS